MAGSGNPWGSVLCLTSKRLRETLSHLLTLHAHHTAERDHGAEPRAAPSLTWVVSPDTGGFEERGSGKSCFRAAILILSCPLESSGNLQNIPHPGLSVLPGAAKPEGGASGLSGRGGRVVHSLFLQSVHLQSSHLQELAQVQDPPRGGDAARRVN